MSEIKNRIAFTVFVTLLGLVLFSANCAEKDYLLTDNSGAKRGENALPKKTRTIKTGAQIKWVAEGEYASDKNMIETGSRPDGKSRVLIDGRTGPEGDSQAFSGWGGGDVWESFIVDLQKPYLITRASLWTQNSEKAGFDYCEMLFSTDGKSYVSVGTFKSVKEKSVGNRGVRTEMIPESAASARHVMFRVKKGTGKWSVVLSEVALWGRHLANGEKAEAHHRPIPLQLRKIDAGAVLLDWGETLKQTEKFGKWRIYQSDKPFTEIDQPGVELREEIENKMRRRAVYPLDPGRTYHFAVSAEYEGQEEFKVVSQPYTVPQPLTRKTFGDMLCVNHFWGGGGARVKGRPNSHEWEVIALQMLGETPLKTTRWWWCHPGTVERFYNLGIGLVTFVGQQQLKNGKKMGIYVYMSSNEPELRSTPPAEHAVKMREFYKMVKESDSRNILCGPVVNINNHALGFLEGLYKANVGKMFDVLDLHTYLGSVADFVQPDGYPTGAPESLYERMKAVKSVISKYGDADIPFISTEYGYSDSPVANPCGEITPERKANYLVRGLVLHYVLGFRRVFIYSFWDEGPDLNYTEHTYGMLSYDLQKKPAFTAICTLGEQLGNATDFRPLSGAQLPDIGYVFADPKNRDYVTVLWNGTGDYSATLRTTPGEVTLCNLYGQERKLSTDASGNFRCRYGKAPIYLRTAKPPVLVKSIKVAGTLEGKALSMTLPKKVLTVMPEKNGAATEAAVMLSNPIKRKVTVVLRAKDSGGKISAAQTVNLEAGQTSLASLPLTESKLDLERYVISADYQNSYDSFSLKEELFLRRLKENTGAIRVEQIKMAGYENTVWSLGNDNITVTIDPARGGQVLEFIDKALGANQINLPYDKLDNLQSANFHYAMWDQIKARPGIGRNSVYHAESIKDGIALRTESGALEFKKEFTISGVSSLKLRLMLKNTGETGVPFSYYLHPEYTIGGSGENHNDILQLPMEGDIRTIPFWTGLGEKGRPRLSDGWWTLTDKAAGVTLRQTFPLETFNPIRLWFGIGACNVELTSTPEHTLAPGETWSSEVEWTLEHSHKK